jgi:sugar phosphate isomerase/epimerase
MFAVSTCWKSSRAECGDDILVPILDCGGAEIELEYRITEEIFREMLPALRQEEPAVVSVHNFFPLPAHMEKEQASGDAFLLSSPDKKERELAVKHTLRTLESAHEVGARAVVLHMGKTEMDDGFERMKEELESGTIDGQESRDYIETLKRERKRVGKKNLDAALFSLDKLWRSAERLGLRLGVENRYYFREVPNADDLEVILDRFDGGAVGYWHDVGHAAVQEALYAVDHERLLSRFSERMIGIHLHDAEGARDHQAPGAGKIDFEMVKKYISPDTIRVIELSPEVSAEELREGMDFLAEVLEYNLLLPATRHSVFLRSYGVDVAISRISASRSYGSLTEPSSILSLITPWQSEPPVTKRLCLSATARYLFSSSGECFA